MMCLFQDIIAHGIAFALLMHTCDLLNGFRLSFNLCEPVAHELLAASILIVQNLIQSSKRHRNGFDRHQ